jgi:hypothetical protein
MRSQSIIYAAGPIEKVGKIHAGQWRSDLARMLFDRGMAMFNPAGAWTLPMDNDRHDPGSISTIQGVCDVALAFSDLVVVAFQGAESVGTDHEIQLAMELRKPIIVYRERRWWEVAEEEGMLVGKSYEHAYSSWFKERFVIRNAVVHTSENTRDIAEFSARWLSWGPDL